MLMTGVIVMCESSNGDYVMLMPGASKRKEKKEKKKRSSKCFSYIFHRVHHKMQKQTNRKRL